jgi:hypothetical protein
VVCGVREVDARPPQCRCKSKDGQKKEHACYLKPDNAAHTAKGAQEATDALAYLVCSLAGELACGLTRMLVWFRRCDRLRLRIGADRSRVSCNSLSGNSASNPDSNPQRASNISRSHPVYDGSSGLRCRSLRDRRGPVGCHRAEMAVR